jgi:uncharacterized protein (TIGR03067 family)
MRRETLLLAALLALPLLGSDPSERYDGAAEPDGIEGTWVRVAAERDGRKADIIAGSLTFLGGGRLLEETTGAAPRAGRFKLDNGPRPARLDIEYASDPPGLGRKFICQVGGDTLKVGFAVDLTAARPGSFADRGTLIVTYRRVKK